MSDLLIRRLFIHAYHGVHPSEKDTGADFTVDLRITFDFSTALYSDSLYDTLDYALAISLIEKEMKVPSFLLEHVAHRCIQSLLNQFPSCASINICICKLHPPLPSVLDAVCVQLCWPEDYSPKK